ncbi:MAG: acyl-CoA dehydrogenase family protein, partial [Beijerinckiaceae bacterium]
GEEGRGVRTIISMVQLTRLDCIVASAGLMRFGLAAAVHHARHRSVFQKKLIDQPLMRAVLADMALEVEAVTALAMRLAAAFDRAHSDSAEAAYARLVTPAAKYYVCKIAPAMLYEAMECHGGNGYVEELPLARAYREAPVNAIWEGSGNVMALDVLRAIASDGESALAAVESIAAGLRAPRMRGAVDHILALLRGPGAEAYGRTVAESIAKIAAVEALSQLKPEFAERFAVSRVGGVAHATLGTDPHAGIADSLLSRV